MTGTSVMEAVAALGLVLLLVVGAGQAAQRLRPGAVLRGGGGAGLLAVEARLALDGRRTLVVVRCGERRALLLTGAQDQVVGWLDGRS